MNTKLSLIILLIYIFVAFGVFSFVSGISYINQGISDSGLMAFSVNMFFLALFLARFTIDLSKFKLIRLFAKFSIETFPIILLYFAGFGYVIFNFLDLNLDTTPVSNGSAVILASLSALSFNWARAIDNSDLSRSEIIYSAERFFHASLFLLMASIFKYISLSLKAWGSSQNPLIIYFSIIVFDLLPPSLFFLALNDAHSGILRIFKLLNGKLGDRKDWDSII